MCRLWSLNHLFARKMRQMLNHSHPIIIPGCWMLLIHSWGSADKSLTFFVATTFTIPSSLTALLNEMQPQTITEPPSFVTDEAKQSWMYFFPLVSWLRLCSACMVSKRYLLFVKLHNLGCIQFDKRFLQSNDVWTFYMLNRNIGPLGIFVHVFINTSGKLQYSDLAQGPSLWHVTSIVCLKCISGYWRSWWFKLNLKRLKELKKLRSPTWSSPFSTFLATWHYHSTVSQVNNSDGSTFSEAITAQLSRSRTSPTVISEQSGAGFTLMSCA